MKRLLFLIFVISTICQAQYKELRWYYKPSDSTYTTVPDFVTLPSADTIDTKVAYADSNSSLGWYRRGYVDALLNAKQNTISNLADTSKYFESIDSSGTSGWYRRGYVDALLNAKQNTITNLTDTSKYIEPMDTANATYGWYKRSYIDALLNAITGTGVITLNGLNGVTQTLAIDTTIAGAPAWLSTGTSHTLQLPFLRFWKKSDFDTIAFGGKYFTKPDSNLTANPITLSYAVNNFAPISVNGTVTTVSVVTANGISGSVANATTTPAITLTLGAITPTTVNGFTLKNGSAVDTVEFGNKYLAKGDSSSTPGAAGKYYTPTMAANASRHLRATIIDPATTYTKDSCICIWNKTDAAITITNLEVSCGADPTTEPTGDIKYADALIGRANPVLINDFDTTNGVRSDASITQPAVPSGKCVFIRFDTGPEAAMKQITFDITYHY